MICVVLSLCLNKDEQLNQKNKKNGKRSNAKAGEEKKNNNKWEQRRKKNKAFAKDILCEIETMFYFIFAYTPSYANGENLHFTLNDIHMRWCVLAGVNANNIHISHSNSYLYLTILLLFYRFAYCLLRIIIIIIIAGVVYMYVIFQIPLSYNAKYYFYKYSVCILRIKAFIQM